MFKKTLLSAVLAAGSLISLVPVAAHAQYNAIVSTAPPPPVQEVMPPERPGFVWAPGHYEWRGDRYVWERGRWIRERVGYEYREPRWVQRGNGEWVLVGGDWVPRGDRYARNHRYDNERDWDRRHRRGPRGDMDGDGVVNRYDRYPRDPDRN